MSQGKDDEMLRTQLREHGRELEDLEQLFKGKLSGAHTTEVYRHVKGCPICARAWSELADAERALFGAGSGVGGRDVSLTPFAADRVRERLFAGRAAEAKQAALRPWWIALGSVAAALLAIVLVRAPDPGSRARGQGDLQARGGATVLSTTIGLRALAVREREGGGLDVEDLASGVSLGRRDHLKLLGTSLGEPRWVSAGVFDASGRAVLKLEPQLLPANAADAGLGRALAVGAEWPEGQIRIVAVFTRERPADDEDLAALSPGDAPGRSVRVLSATLEGAGR